MVTRNEPGSDHSKEPKNLQRFRLFSSYLSPFEAVGPEVQVAAHAESISQPRRRARRPPVGPPVGVLVGTVLSAATRHRTTPRTLHRAWGSTPPTSKRRALRFSVPPHGLAQATGSRVCARRCCAPSSDYSSPRVHFRAAGPAAPLISSTQNVRAAAGATGGGASLPSRRC